MDEAEAARIGETTEAALAVRQVLDQYRRREAELVALFDTAGDLAGLRDLAAVRRTIVRRARTLLGADVAYLTLNDPVAHDTFMRVTDGSVSAAFQQPFRPRIERDGRPPSQVRIEAARVSRPFP